MDGPTEPAAPCDEAGSGADQAGEDGLSEPVAAGSLAAKIDRLFRTTRPPGATSEYTYEQVATAIAERGGPTISASYLYLLRRGLRDNPTKRHLEALAGFFGVPASYFIDAHDPAEEERLGLLSALRDPRVHRLAMTAAALPDAELDVVSQLVTLAGDLEGIRGAARRRGGSADGPAPAGPAGASSLPHPDRAAELELAYARIDLQNGQAEEALRHLSSIEHLPRIRRALRDEGAWLSALAHEALDRPDRALAILQDQLDRCLNGTGELPLAQIGEQICQLALDAGDRLLALDAGRRTLAGLEERGLSGTAEHVRLAAMLLDVQGELGQPLHAAALAQRILALVDGLADPQQQIATYLSCAHAAQARGRLGEAVGLSNRALALVEATDDEIARQSLDVPRLRLEAASCLLRCVAPRSQELAKGVNDAEVPEIVTTAVAALEATRIALGEHGSPPDRGRWAAERAVADLVVGQPVTAEVNARRALAHLSRLARPTTVEAHLVLGDALRAQGRDAHADAAHEQAGRVLTGLPERWRPWSAGIWRSLGDRWLDRGQGERAADAYHRALDATHLLPARPQPRPVG